MNKSKLGIFLLSAVFLSSNLISPSFASADNNKNKGKNEEKKEEKKQNKELKKGNKFEDNICWNGFFKKNLPNGIWKKWVAWGIQDDCIKVRGGTASSTPDTTAPTISNIINRTTTNKAFISWNTNEKASGKIYYSTTSPVSTADASTKSSFEIGQGKNHYLGIGSLTPNTTYYALIESKDPSGNTSTSSQFSFITKFSTTTSGL